ncbi:flagellar biosynthetic protein FliR [Diplocloster agilis]|uniref:flagellar biosynthetic protein FliR n=1 Tax=Diplocloster agilis TaxID=2850323 RepID=UPI000820571A|nr:flagellar biosynthetic protein FliR [Suonthocola fibrivorans]MCU6734578.1 flagellar biosynthetic protein FliR [Suonthocola fibrivorans]SCJ45004.1 flagellar biosynthesis protein FliR [uncultured Clostridium sp.]
MNGLLGYFDVFLLVFARMGGAIFSNPMFTKRNVPMRVRAGLVLALSLLIAPGLSGNVVSGFNTLEMAMALMKEVVLGLCMGLILQIFFYMIFVAGDLLDTVFGLSMGKVMDPVNGVSASIFGQLLNVCFFLYLFATGTHLLLIKVYAYSFEMIPVGTYMLVVSEISAFVMVIKLALPFVAAEFILEAAMGVLMKLIPQIHVFVINLQVKILAGMLLMMLFAQPVGNFIDRYITVMFDEIQRLLTMI